MRFHSLASVCFFTSAALLLTCSVRAQDVETEHATELLVAIARADAGAVQALLTEHPALVTTVVKDTSEHQEGPSHALARSVAFNDLDVVKTLLAHGVDVNVLDSNSRAAIHYVRSPQMVALLLGVGADVQPKGASALPVPVSPVATLRDKTTPLGRATADALIDAGATMRLDDAIELNRPRDVQRIVEVTSETPTTADLYLAITAMGWDEVELLSTLLELGAPLDGSPPTSPYANWSYPDSIVIWAIQHGQFEAATLLLDRGAAKPRPTDPGWPIIRLGSRRPGEDLLDRAIEGGHAGLVERLLRSGFDPDQRDSSLDGEGMGHDRRLHRAVWLGHTPIVEALLKRGAGPDLEGDEAAMALVAAAAGHVDLHDYLMQHGAPASVHALAVLGRTDELASALEGQRIEAADGRLVCTPLAWAVLYGQKDSVAALLERGADPNVRLPWRLSQDGTVGSVGFGGRATMPKVRPGDRAMQVPCSLAAHAVDAGDLELAQVLLAGGAKPDASLILALAESSDAKATPMLAQVLAHPERDAKPGWARRALVSLVQPRSFASSTAPTVSDGDRLERLRLILDEGPALVDEFGNSWIDRLRRADAPSEFARAFAKAGAVVTFEAACVLNLREYGASDEALRGLTAEERDAMISQAFLAEQQEAVERLLATAGEARASHEQVLRKSEAVAGERQLHRASAEKRLKSIRALLRAGADPNRRVRRDGELPLEALVKTPAGRERLVPCLRVLLEAGADPMRTASNGSMVFEVLLGADVSDATRAQVVELLVPLVGRGVVR